MRGEKISARRLMIIGSPSSDRSLRLRLGRFQKSRFRAAVLYARAKIYPRPHGRDWAEKRRGRRRAVATKTTTVTRTTQKGRKKKKDEELRLGK